MFGKILFPTDFSDHARRTLDCLIGLPGIREVLLLHVIDSRDVPTPAVRESHIEEAHQLLAATRILLERFGIRVSAALRITTGTGVAQTIESVAEEEGFPTIVMSARGKGFIPGIPLGSVSEGVLHCTKRDLLIMRYRMIEEMTGIRYEKFCPMILSKILVATDLSPGSSNAIMRLVKTEGVGEIILVHVISRGETEAEIIASEEAARTTIREHCNQIHQEGLQSRGIVLTGDPASVIIDLTEEQDVSMVCTVPHGKGFMQRLLYGSFSGDLARHVNRPLLIIHKPE